MKINIKLTKQVKPRNPLVAAARARKAGAHGAYHPARSERRVGKQKLSVFLSHGKGKEDFDA